MFLQNDPQDLEDSRVVGLNRIRLMVSFRSFRVRVRVSGDVQVISEEERESSSRALQVLEFFRGLLNRSPFS